MIHIESWAKSNIYVVFSDKTGAGAKSLELAVWNLFEADAVKNTHGFDEAAFVASE